MTSELTLLGTLFAGLLSFLSPCVLPLVPPYLTYLAGSSLDELTGEQDSRTIRNRALGNAAFFVLGFTCVFVALGAGASTFSQVIRQNQDVLSTIAGVVIIAMGLHFLGVFRFALMYREARVQVSPELTRSATAAGAFVMGLAFAFGWTPCIGPILGVILGMASTSDTVGEGAFMLGVYSLGLGIPFMLAALFAGPFLRFLQRFRRHLGLVEKAMGLLLVLTGIAFLTGGMQTMAFWLLETFPALQQLG
ncbi:cytochrome c biogenesis CcdA family protein [Ahrensia sp. R2A130]|uniref:cytochrome c biogenesis CcdA family protein n=1 Tax=Ahrensia sp. R2A130 TaxID=744979 RepID=UPI0001E0E054|nr:cytochrome c biogenesis protein CcdA [Ahrensia sp. R2A130]EFL90351.1 cytochrome c-type biogenesis protein CcdA [Ahrensia sp. R2A130]